MVIWMLPKFEILPKKMYTLIMKKGGGKMKLDLDFSIGSSDDRAKFVSKYLKSVDPTTVTDTNLELTGTYILWGKHPDGFNSKQKKSFSRF